MNPAAGTTRSWAAQGVQHELLLRMLRAVRHDLMAPLSVARMAGAMVRRRLDSAPPDVDQALLRAVELEAHLAQLAQSLRELRHWDAEQAGVMTLHEAALLCSGWFRAPLALRGFELQDPPASPAAGPALPRLDATYVVAGLLAHAHDCWAPGALALHIDPDTARVSLLGGEPMAPSALSAPATSPFEGLLIDTAALHLLCEGLGWSLARVAGGIELTRRG